MKYMGSKRRILKHILPIMLADKKENQLWCEPFVGGGNVIENIPGCSIGADINPHVIRALVAVRDYAHLLPKNNKEFTKKDYSRLLKDENFYPLTRDLMLYQYAFGAKYKGKWADDYSNRDIVKACYNSAIKQSKKIKNVSLVDLSYNVLAMPCNSFIYCDPPYEKTDVYESGEKFDYKAFWSWCRYKVKHGHTVYVSETTAPGDISCVWEGKIKHRNGKERIERLYKV